MCVVSSEGLAIPLNVSSFSCVCPDAVLALVTVCSFGWLCWKVIKAKAVFDFLIFYQKPCIPRREARASISLSGKCREQNPCSLEWLDLRFLFHFGLYVQIVGFLTLPIDKVCYQGASSNSAIACQCLQKISNLKISRLWKV